MAVEALRIAAVAIIALCCITLLKSWRPELAVILSIAAGTAVLMYGINLVSGIVDAADSLFMRCGLDKDGMAAAGRIVGIAYIAQFCSDTCRDCGESSLAGKVELAGRLMMVGAAVPLVISTLDAIGGIMKP